ncbi:unnamed protein product [Absidia cylindrospora]
MEELVQQREQFYQLFRKANDVRKMNYWIKHQHCKGGTPASHQQEEEQKSNEQHDQLLLTLPDPNTPSTN